MKKICAAIAAILILFSALGCTKNKSGKISESGFLMDTVVSVTLYGNEDEDILKGCFDELSRFDKLWSRTSPESEIYRLNSGEISEVSEDTADLLRKALYFSKLSGGAFDVSICPESELWSFKDGGRVPDAEAINEALKKVGYENITVTDENEVLFSIPGAEMDLGGIAKGYAADKLKEYLLANGVESAVINLGGNTLCVGEKPDGSAFKVGIQYPFKDQNEIIALLCVKDMSVVTSGVYERSFEKDGKLYHHLLDPSTGYPAKNNLLSVSIICKSSADADALSTACFVLGLDEGMKLINSMDGYYAIFITDDFELHYSEGAEAFLV